MFTNAFTRTAYPRRGPKVTFWAVLCCALAFVSTATNVAAAETPIQVLDATQWMPARADGTPDLRKALAVVLSKDLYEPRVKNEPVWYRFTFKLDRAPTQRQAIYFPALYVQVEPFINGHPLGATGKMTDMPERSWRGARIFEIPESYLNAGENEVFLRVGGRNAWTFAPPEIGDRARLQARYTQKIVATAIAPLAMGAMVALLGIFVLALWIHQRGEALYGYFGVAATIWGLHTVWFLTPTSLFPMPHNRVLWTATYTLWISLFVIFFVRYTGQPHRRFERFMWCFAILGYPVMYIAQYAGVFPIASVALRAISIVCVLIGLIIVVRFAWRTRRVDGVLLMLTGGVSLGFGVYDWHIARTGALNPVWLVPYAGLAYLILFGWLLATRFNRDLDALEQSHETLNQRVAEKSHELGVNHERLRQIEQQQAALEERSHILRDMHDGLGTKLMISLRSLERGEIDSDKAAAVVRECIDELRLIVDASGQTDGDIAGLLANLRYRLGERLQRAGLAIEWRVTDTPPVPALTGGNGQELMHIVQACLNNILQHANASAITFETQYLTDDKNVVLSIRDNGRGFDAFAATNIADHGIANMRMRAERLGAMLAVISAPTGSEIRLTFPLVVSSKH